MKLILTGAIGALLIASPLIGQVVPRQFQVTVEAGWQAYDKSAALDAAPVGGLRGVYWLNRQVGIGAHLTAGRPLTRGHYFPFVRHSSLSSDESNDTTLLYIVNQRITHLQYGVDANLRYEFGRLAPFGNVSVGSYRLFLDPQENNGLQNPSGLTLGVGGGIDIGVSATSGIRLSVSDQIFRDFDRDRFCSHCSGSYVLLMEDRFPNPFPVPPAKKSTVHNLRMVAGFIFVPGGVR